MHARRFQLIALAVSLFLASPVAAQFQARTVNPEAIEFENAQLLEPGATGYRIEFFLAGSDTQRDYPVKVLNLPPGVVQEGGRVRVIIRDFVLDMPNGQYVATIRTVAGARLSARSASTDPFALSQAGAPEDRVAADRHERFWTKVGIAIGASVILLPVVIR